MYFNDTTGTENSLYHYTKFLLGLLATDTTSFPIADFTRSANSWTRNAVFEMWKNSGFWEFDDSNYTTLPTATCDLVDSQQDYSMPTNALDIQRVEVLDSSGNYQLLTQLDKSLINESSMSEYYETAGMPRYYDVMGNSVLLYPKPSSGNVTTTAGLKLYLARDIDAFATTDTTQEPGFPAPFHPYVAYGAAFDYAVAKNLDANKISTIRLGISSYQDAIKNHSVLKNRDIKVKIRRQLSNSI